jgi:hypothetical protein
MNKTLKYTTALGSAMFALAFAVTAASAQTTDLVNTGDDVEVEAGSSYELDVNVENSNEAYISQSSYNFVNTGNNDTDGNIGGGNIDSGNAVATNDFSVQANSNTTDISGAGFSGGADTDASIVNTGDDLEAELGSEYDVEVDVENDNEARIEQFSFNYANTGDNETDDNIGGGDIDSGDALGENTFSVMANANMTEISLAGMFDGDDSETNVTNTGDDLEVESGLEVEVEVDVESDNASVNVQTTVNGLQTGDNDADDNIGGGDTNSGNAGVWTEFLAELNGNWTSID